MRASASLPFRNHVILYNGVLYHVSDVNSSGMVAMQASIPGLIKLRAVFYREQVCIWLTAVVLTRAIANLKNFLVIVYVSV